MGGILPKNNAYVDNDHEWTTKNTFYLSDEIASNNQKWDNTMLIGLYVLHSWESIKTYVNTAWQSDYTLNNYDTFIKSIHIHTLNLIDNIIDYFTHGYRYSHTCFLSVLFCFAEGKCYLHNIDTIITIILFFPGTRYREIWCLLKLNTPLLHRHRGNCNQRNLPAIRYCVELFSVPM